MLAEAISTTRTGEGKRKRLQRRDDRYVATWHPAMHQKWEVDELASMSRGMRVLKARSAHHERSCLAFRPPVYFDSGASNCGPSHF